MFTLKRLTFTALCLAIAGAAFAADDALQVEKPIRVLGGIFSPASGGGGSRTSLGVGYDFSKSTAKNPSVYGVYLDYNSKKSAGVTTSLTGIGVSSRFYLDSANKAGKPYASVGVGSYTFKSGASSSKLGAKLELGYELNDGFLVSLDYTASQKVAGKNTGGTNFRIGYRF